MTVFRRVSGLLFGAVLLASSACTPEGVPTAGLGPVATGRLSVGIVGLPTGASASVTVTNALGFQQSLSGTQQLTGLTPGTYTITALEVVADDDRYAPAPSSQNVAVTAAVSPTIASVAYVAITGRLQLTITGAPLGAVPAVTLTGPGSYLHTAAASELLTGLAAGTYQVTAPSFTLGGDRYDSNPAALEVAVTPGSPAPAQAAIAYGVATGRLVVTVGGLPGAAVAAVQVTGPGGFAATVSRTDTLIGLAPGSYTVATGPVTFGGSFYTAIPASASVPVTAGATSGASVVYQVSVGGLAVSIGGLPDGTGASVTVTGPGGFSQSLTASQTFAGLQPGNYTIAASNVLAGGYTYAPSPPTQQPTVTASSTATATVSYTASTGSLTILIAGLPGGTAGAVTVTGPAGFSQQLTTSQTLSGLTPGSYSVNASTVSGGGTTYAPAPPNQTVSVTAGATTSAAVGYASSVGGLAVSITGLPGGTGASVTVTGPGGFSQLLTATQTLTGLTPGSYTVLASNVVNGPTTYAPLPVSQSATILAGATASAAVTYAVAGGGATLNLTVSGVYLTQATQKFDGSVPLVAGRSAYLRVFALANQSNSTQPLVRVRLYNGAVLLQTYSISASGSSVPTAVDEGTLTSSWNVLVPGTLVQPNLRVLAEVDPAGSIAESDEVDNQFPLSGTPGAVDVRLLPTFNIRFVPVLQQVNGLTGNVSAGNQESFLNDLKKLLPVGSYDADIRAPYTTTAPALQNDNANGAWGTILSELLTLKFTEGSSRYYYGVVKTTYSSGVAGIGYVGGSARTALGWDNLPSGSSVMAHELGHNMGRQHAPCGGVASPDPAFPYAGGKIGVWGFDMATLALKSPLTYIDLMGYCSPVWVSDYNWSAMVAYRQGGPNNAPASDLGTGQGLLVWGRITPGGVVLEPAFTVAAAASLLPVPGPHRLELQAVDGSLLRTVSFEASEVADLPGQSERHFAFVVPMSQALSAALGRITIRSSVGTVSRAPTTASGLNRDPAAVVTRPNLQQLDVRWDAARYPMVMVRDAVTGQVVSFARGGAARLWTRGSRFDLQFSDGLTSVLQRRALQ